MFGETYILITHKKTHKNYKIINRNSLKNSQTDHSFSKSKTSNKNCFAKKVDYQNGYHMFTRDCSANQTHTRRPHELIDLKTQRAKNILQQERTFCTRAYHRGRWLVTNKYLSFCAIENSIGVLKNYV